MSEVEFVVTESRIWARGARTHWDVTPSVVPTSDASGLVAGEPLSRNGQVSSAVQHLAGDRIALQARVVPTVVDAIGTVVGTVFDNLRVGTPCDRLTVICPTIWGQRERAAFQAAVVGFAHDVVFHCTALRASELDPATQRSRRTVVLEFGLLSAVASSVVYDHQGARIETTEHEPNLSGDELRREAGITLLVDLLKRAAPDEQADVVQIFGVSDPTIVAELAGVVESLFGADAQVSSFTERDLSRVAGPVAPAQPTVPASPEWMQPLRARAAAMEPPSRVPKYVAAAVAAVLVGAGIGAVVAVTANSGDSSEAAETALQSTTTSTLRAPAQTTTPAVRPSVVAFGRLESTVPSGWTRTNDTSRLVFTPEVGASGRIIVATKPIDAGASLADLAADLDAQAKKRPAGTVTPVQSGTAIGARTGLSYEEHPGDGSVVRWLVFMETGAQVSIGCQYLPDARERVTTACDAVVASIRVSS